MITKNDTLKLWDEKDSEGDIRIFYTFGNKPHKNENENPCVKINFIRARIRQQNGSQEFYRVN